MPVNFIQQKKKQKKMLLIVIGVIIITALILWLGYFREPKESVSETPEISSIRRIRVNFEVLKSPFLKGFDLFEKIPPFEGELGQENPFLPY